MTGRLLAKSYDRLTYPDGPPPFALLTQHSRDVPFVARALSRRYTRLGLSAMGLPADAHPGLTRALVACCWLQDIGKANNQFLEMVGGEFGRSQLLRHEAVSLILFSREPLRAWISSLGALTNVALWGAGAHHRKFFKGLQPRADCSVMRVFLSHPDFRAILEDVARDLELDAPPNLGDDLTIGGTRHDRAQIIAIEAVDELVRECEEAAAVLDESSKSLLPLVKAFGIASDVAASALARKVTSDAIAENAESMLCDGHLSSEDLSKVIFSWASKLPGPGRSEVKANCLRPFQLEIAASESYLTLARAGCGAGKSVGAYLWARTWARRFEDEGRHEFRLFFTLPTTGTTTEHFRDYALECGVPSDLAHSRARVDLKTIAETAPQEEGPEQSNTAEAARIALRSAQEKIEALRLWSTPIIVSTSDAVLGLMSNALRPLCSIPAIVSSAVVFDEIHAFDDTMFGHLLVFLRLFSKLPVLLMTASLQRERVDALRAVRPDLRIVAGPPDLELLRRYVLQVANSADEIDQAVRSCVAEAGKVLWVRNRVAWANETFRSCRRSFPDAFVQVYHSRFRYRDRSKRHRSVIDQFKKPGHSAILVATQVAEMSLDLSADLLVTDFAPIPALIQRMGRLNRYWMPGQPGEAKPALFVRVRDADAMPYSHDDLSKATKWLWRLISSGAPVSQRDLFEQFASASPEKAVDIGRAEGNAEFVAGVWETVVGQTREEGHTVTVLLKRDYDHWRAESVKEDPPRDWLREHEVSIPLRKDVIHWPRHGYMPIAPADAITYDWDDNTEEGPGADWN